MLAQVTTHCFRQAVACGNRLKPNADLQFLSDGFLHEADVPAEQ